MPHVIIKSKPDLMVGKNASDVTGSAMITMQKTYMSASHWTNGPLLDFVYYVMYLNTNRWQHSRDGLPLKINHVSPAGQYV